jgi:F0F1-type ATP synthase assembly protein I
MAPPWRRLGIYLELVYTFPSAVLVGTALGYFADRWAGSKPYGTLIGFLAGLAGAFWYLFKMLNKAGEKGRREKGEKG